MKHIKATQTQALSSASSTASGSTKSHASVLPCIDERLIVDELLGVYRGHQKGVRCIVNGKGKASFTALRPSHRCDSLKQSNNGVLMRDSRLSNMRLRN